MSSVADRHIGTPMRFPRQASTLTSTRPRSPTKSTSKTPKNSRRRRPNKNTEAKKQLSAVDAQTNSYVVEKIIGKKVVKVRLDHSIPLQVRGLKHKSLSGRQFLFDKMAGLAKAMEHMGTRRKP